MPTITPSVSPSPGLHDLSIFKDGPHTSRTRQVDTRAQANADLTVVTAEGDKVTLSASSDLQTAYASYDAQGRVHGQSFDVHAAALDVTVTDAFAVSVKGDLNDQELADLHHLLSDIEAIATGFFAGDLDDDLLQDLDIGDFNTLSSFDATLELTQHVSTAQLLSTTGGRHDTGSSGGKTITAASTERLIDEIMQTVQGAKAATGQFAGKMPELLSQLFTKLAEQHDFDAAKRQLATDIPLQVAERLDESAQTAARPLKVGQ